MAEGMTARSGGSDGRRPAPQVGGGGGGLGRNVMGLRRSFVAFSARQDACNGKREERELGLQACTRLEALLWLREPPLALARSHEP